MRTFSLYAFLVILCGIVFGADAQRPSQAILKGSWEGVIQGAIRPVVLALDFGSRTARLDITGTASWEIGNLSNEAGQLRFRISLPGGQMWRFEGEQRELEIQGRVQTGDKDIPFWLRRLPELPVPRDRVEAWQQDLDTMLTRFVLYDRSFSAKTRAAFINRIDKIQHSLQSRPDQEIMVELARAVALSGNAHTRLYLVRNRTEVRRLPIRVWWFKDHLHIVRAMNGQKDLLGCRVLGVGAIGIAAAAASVRGIEAGNTSWQRYMSTYFLTSPDILYGVGVIPSPDQVAMAVSCDGRPRIVELAPLPLKRQTAPVEAWWDLAPSYEGPNKIFLPALKVENCPRYLRYPEKGYWYEYVPEYRAIYLQYNRSQEREDMPMSEFTESLMSAVDQRKPKALIFDLRFNTGGNLEVGTPLVKSVAEKLGSLPVFVITGRATFSAGITHVAQLRQWTRARIVGEPVGDGLDMWSEGGNLTLPNSRLTVHYANAFHAYSRREYPDRRPYFLDLDVDSVRPEITVEPNWTDYIQGKDPVLDAVVERIRRIH